MKIVSLDIETSGLDPKSCVILEVAMVIEDTDSPEVEVDYLPAISNIVSHEGFYGEPTALYMNRDLIRILSTGEELSRVLSATEKWLEGQLGMPPYTVAGKNVAGFDLPFFPTSFRNLFRRSEEHTSELQSH